MKKKYPFVLATILAINSVQAQDNFTYTKMADSLLYPVNKSLITSGILYDRVVPFTSLHSFKNTDTSSYVHFTQAYSELRNAAYNNSSMIKVEKIDTASKGIYYASATVPIGVLYFDFHWIDTLAINKNLFYKGADSLLHDVAGRSSSPYFLKNITIASALPNDTLNFGNGIVKFKYISQLFVTNKGVTITNINADFGTGNQNLTSGSTITVNYGSSGKKTIKFTITYSNGQVATAYSKIFLRAPSPSNRYGSSKNADEYYDIDDTYGYQGYGETAKKYNRGRYGIYYHYTSPTSNTVEKVIRKPIIVLDGFDPEYKRDIDELFGVYLQYSPTTSDNFGENMRKKGYDVIVLDFPRKKIADIVLPPPFGTFENYQEQGADFIQRNAFVLVKLIEHINSKLAAIGSTEKLVVIGPSMGGLISRYALRWMEQNSKNHNCRLWISFDSPHKGANIPIGDQYFVDFYASKAGNEKAKKGRDVSLNSPAAKQMLLHHFSSNTITPSGATNFRDVWQTEIDNMGYPQNVRRLALLNGAINGITQGTACQNVFKVNAKLVISNVFFMFAGFINVAEGNIWFTGSNGSACQVFKGWAKVPPLWNATKSAAAPASSKSYDIVPGGYYDTQATLGGGTTYEFAHVPLLFGISMFFTGTTTITNSQVLNPLHSFIPTFSALGMNLTGKDLSENLYNRDLVCSGETPFHAYYAPTVNQEHITLTPENVAWITKEIDGIKQMSTVNYSTLYPMVKTAGSDPVCSSTSYQINNLPAGSSIIWTSSSPTVASITPSGNPAIITRQGLGSGTVTFTAVVTRPCGDPIALTKTLTIGSPYFPYSIDGASPASPSGGYTYALRTTPINKIVSDIVWSIPSGWSITLGQGTRDLRVMTGSASGNVSISFRDFCGTSFGTSKFVTIGPGGPLPDFVEPGNSTLQVSPNPSTNIINVSLMSNKLSKSPGSTTEKLGIYEIIVKDQSGITKKQTKYNGGASAVSINVQSLQPGVYYLNVYDGKLWRHTQVLVAK